MDSIHDMGGMDGFGSPDPEDDSLWHETWEAKADGLGSVVSSQGHYQTVELRHARARLDPAYYLTSSYMGRKLGGYEMLCIEKGLVTVDELVERIESLPAGDHYEDGLPQREDPALVQRIRESNLNKGGGERPPQVDPAFELGQTVRVRNRHPKDHTRCPRYVRRATGTVDRIHGTSELPDAKVKGERQLETLYSVEFESTELWGDDHPESHDVTLNLWESYLTEP